MNAASGRGIHETRSFATNLQDDVICHSFATCGDFTSITSCIHIVQIGMQSNRQYRDGLKSGP